MSGMCMWRWVLLILLTVLLPLRGAMALSMGLADADTLPRTTAMTSAEEAPCPHHAQSGEQAPAAPMAHSDDSHNENTHLLCDVCNVLALGVSVPVTARTDVRPAHTPQRSERFSSVVPPIGHKPPIPV